MGEVERYQGLVKERDQLNARWDEQNSLLVQSHERVIQDLTEEYDQKLQEEQVSFQPQQLSCSKQGCLWRVDFASHVPDTASILIIVWGQQGMPAGCKA